MTPVTDVTRRHPPSAMSGGNRMVSAGRRARNTAYSLISAVLFCLAIPSAWALDPARVPGQNFDLSQWKLQTPLPGTPQILQPQLATYFSNIFYTAADGSMVFWVPTAGEPLTVGGYPRTELREIISGTGGGWAITNNVVHTLTATCKILTNPPSKKTIIGQIHGIGVGSEALKLQWVDGTVRAAFKDNYGGSQIYLNFGRWNLGATLTYSIQQSNHLITVTVNGVTVTYLLNSTWDADAYYFKAGNYCSDNSTNTDTECVVAFYALNSAAGSVGAPSFSTVAGTYSSGQTVTIKTSTPGSSIRYSINGSTPTPTSGTLYSSPVNISATTTLKAIAYDSILPASTVTAGTYTINPLNLPAITNQPASQSVIVGGNATFTVGANGGIPLAYQWRFNGTNRAGATSPVLTLANVQAANAGGYSVIITNAAGSVTSAVATLTVQPYPPQLIQCALLPDGNCSLTISGAAGFAYRLWAGTNLALPLTNNWMVLTGGTFGIAPVIIPDLDATNYQYRFYNVTIP